MALAIIAILLGGMFFGFGVAIVAFRRYDLISGYTPKKGERYARRAGLIQMIGGGICIAGGAAGLAAGQTFAYIGLFLGVGALLLLGYLNDRGTQ